MEPEQDRGRRLLCFGAHPDDCEIKSAGLAALWTLPLVPVPDRDPVVLFMHDYFTRPEPLRPAYEVSEYAAPLTNQATATLFPF